ncbi:STAS/SEC14 domain-containing protein [Bathymodiolus japonicus methanotrophic gill symbiont]|uniref:STAS/SEC14 domain-containing protein n=1 Tax=Bathymodiolus japonicus methanotrophic gill symbiont TaxID=113269 RepID=UPI001C8D5EF8|nr:STAS/SEC14 domain-containing protein [Bathymodiolus japonicus methanotrophic gill symbiont]
MLEILDIGVERAIAYRLAGKVTEKDMKLAFGIIKEKIEQYGEVYIYQEIDDFIGMEFDAMTEKFKYLFENGVSNITIDFQKINFRTNKNDRGETGL